MEVLWLFLWWRKVVVVEEKLVRVVMEVVEDWLWW
jgi:hypothetical protein